MKRIILCGCNGKMGRILTECIRQRCDCTVVAGFDLSTESHAGFPVFATPENCQIEADVIIDFSHPSSLKGVLRYAKAHRLPAVIATTGLSAEDMDAIEDAGREIPVFHSANMSLGISLLAALARQAAAVLGEDFDVEIVEKHHNQKIDAPSGTALMLADAVEEGLPYKAERVFDRHAVRQKRTPHEIGFSCVRGGTIVGEHDILFCGRDEVITLSHSAASKELFATGAISAALFLCDQPAGRYTMSDVVKSVG